VWVNLPSGAVFTDAA